MRAETLQITWLDDDGQPQHADWRSLAGHPPPANVVVADDALSADTAYRLAGQGTGQLWRGDYQNARHLLVALGHRVDAAAQGLQQMAGILVITAPQQAGAVFGQPVGGVGTQRIVGH